MYGEQGPLKSAYLQEGPFGVYTQPVRPMYSLFLVPDFRRTGWCGEPETVSVPCWLLRKTVAVRRAMRGMSTAVDTVKLERAGECKTSRGSLRPGLSLTYLACVHAAWYLLGTYLSALQIGRCVGGASGPFCDEDRAQSTLAALRRAGSMSDVSSPDIRGAVTGRRDG